MVKLVKGNNDINVKDVKQQVYFILDTMLIKEISTTRLFFSQKKV